MELYASAAEQIDLTVRDVRALARAALSVVQPEAEEPVPERLLAAIRGLARATEAPGLLPPDLRSPSRRDAPAGPGGS